MITRFEQTKTKLLLNIHLTKWHLIPTYTIQVEKDITTITTVRNLSILFFSITHSGTNNI